MAEAARYSDHFAPDVDAAAVAPPSAGWSGEVYGPVAALHQAIEAGLTSARLDADAVGLMAERPIDRLGRMASRLTGWTALAIAFTGTAALIF